MLEQNKKVTNIWRVQFNKLVLDVFLSFALKKLKVFVIVIIEQMFTQERFTHTYGLTNVFTLQMFS
jgi:hypothetical protein